MRTKKFLKNSVIIVICQVICYLMDFVCRTVFIQTVAIEYVGVKGLFSNILNVLSLSELGIGTVLVYSMYKPLAENDEDKLLALNRFYRKAYHVVALIMGGVGICLTPFLKYLIKDCPDLPDLWLIYLLYLANSICSYIYCYKPSLLSADQKMYVSTIHYSFFSILRNIVQIIILFATHNFVFYVLAQIPFCLLQNIVVSKKAEAMYPFLKRKDVPALDPEEKKEIFKNIFAMFNHRIGATILNSTDNLIISKFMGIVVVAVNDTYVLITNIINQLLTQIFSALISSVGNLNVSASKESSYSIFKQLQFCSFWFYTFCTICLYMLLNPFITIFFGEKYLFPMPIVFILCVNFYIVGIRKIPLTFKEAMGLLQQDKFKPLIEAFINLVISIIGVKLFGTFGVFLGTFISMVTTSLWVEPYVLFKYGFQRSSKEFWLTNIKYFLLTALIMAVTVFLGTLYTAQSVVFTLIYRLILCIFVPNIMILLLFLRSKVLKELLNTLPIRDLFQKKKQS